MELVQWDMLIEEHYLSVCKRNPHYGEKHSREEMKAWWYKRIESNPEITKDFIEGSTHANNNGYNYHPV